MKATSGFQDYLRRTKAPATYAIIGVSLAVFVLSWLMQGKLLHPLTFYTDWSQPWGIFTYPFADSGNGVGLFWFLLELYWLFWVGTSTENDLGTPKYLAFFFAISAIAAAFVWAGIKVVRPGETAGLMGLELPIAALTVAWGTRHPHQTILLFAIIPIPGWILAWLTVALTLFGMGTILGAPLMGLFASLHLGLAYLFASNKVPFASYSMGATMAAPRAQMKRTEEHNKKFSDDIRRREKEREERERLRKLFESSMDDDSER